ncbi:MAG TPA: Spx/MgsR family RNA polymerase-binding regulatory protein [Chitinophagales bacterium]|nr:Spx/MgsR family RNA polymerase-binding regulatory protein [Chitinophagales bacterium]
MSEVKIYEYSKCGTCRNALKFLNANHIEFEKVPIVDTPPSLKELQTMLKYLKAKGMKINQLFNTSGVMYREMGLSKKINSMSEEELLELLAANGKLIKRPFVLLEDDGLVGFKEEEWKEKLEI